MRRGFVFPRKKIWEELAIIGDALHAIELGGVDEHGVLGGKELNTYKLPGGQRSRYPSKEQSSGILRGPDTKGEGVSISCPDSSDAFTQTLPK